VLVDGAVRVQQNMTPAESSPVRNQPLVVARGVRLLYLSIAVSIVNFFLEGSIITGVDILGAFFLCIFVWSAMAGLALKIGEGCNWARIALCIWFLFGLPFSIHGLWRLFSYSFILDVLSFAAIALQVVAFVMLFGRGSRSWFQSANTNPSIQTDDTKNST
jgi:hypothetical protein